MSLFFIPWSVRARLGRRQAEGPHKQSRGVQVASPLQALTVRLQHCLTAESRACIRPLQPCLASCVLELQSASRHYHVPRLGYCNRKTQTEHVETWVPVPWATWVSVSSSEKHRGLVESSIEPCGSRATALSLGPAGTQVTHLPSRYMDLGLNSSPQVPVSRFPAFPRIRP